ncbi:MAG: hypothetical protein JXQ27_08080 [Acidobacteria bacterium]|nr:hypothetical protein [Acidobacteriota bacterium]
MDRRHPGPLRVGLPAVEVIAADVGSEDATRILSFPGRVVTAARRLRHHGLVRTQLRNAWLVWLYLRGTPPDELARRYNRPPG